MNEFHLVTSFCLFFFTNQELPEIYVENEAFLNTHILFWYLELHKMQLCGSMKDTLGKSYPFNPKILMLRTNAKTLFFPFSLLYFQLKAHHFYLELSFRLW